MSRSVSPELPTSEEDFFKSVSTDGFPAAKETAAKAQPWRELVDGAQAPSPDGKCVVACPKKFVTYGSNNLGGY